MSNIDAYNTELDSAAAASAKWLEIGNAIYKDIPTGGLFRFKGSNETYVKLSRGYRVANNTTAPIFRTGQRAAVFRV